MLAVSNRGNQAAVHQERIGSASGAHADRNLFDNPRQSAARVMSGPSTAGDARGVGTTTESALRRVFAAVFKLDEKAVTDDMSPDSVDAWDSFGHMQLVTAVETALDIRLRMDQVLAVDSFAALCRIVGEAASQ